MGVLGSYLGLSGGDPFDDRYFTGGAVVNLGDTAAGPESSLKIATVWRAVNVLAGGLAVLPVNVFKQLYDSQGEPDGKEIQVKDPRRRLIRKRPNQIQTSYRWRHHMMGQLLLGGNYYQQRIGNPYFPNQLWPLDPNRMRVDNIRGDGSLEYRYVQKNGQPKGLTQDEVIHYRGFTLDGITGVSVIELMRDTTNLALNARRQRSAFIKNEMRPSVVITHPQALGDKTTENIQKGFKRAYGGPNNAGDVMVLEEGAKIESFGINSRDAQYVESEAFLIEEFCRYIGVPSILAGHSDKTTTFASAEQFFQSFVTHGLYPWTRNVEEELGFTLFEFDDDIFAQFNLDAMLRADSAARAAFYRAMVELGIYTRNEVRELENKNPLEGLDEPLTPKNMSQGPEDPTKAPPAPAPRRLPPADEPPDDGSDARARAIVRLAAHRVVRRELLALRGDDERKGAAVRFAGDPAGWRAHVTTFYERHAAHVAETLALGEDTARDYCAAQVAALLARGLEATAAWETDRVADLERLALGAA